MGCLDYKICKNYQKECSNCSKWYDNKFELVELKDDECQCFSCKKFLKKTKYLDLKTILKKDYALIVTNFMGRSCGL